MNAENPSELCEKVTGQLPVYRMKLTIEQLEWRAAELRELMHECTLCPHECRAGRLEGYGTTVDHVEALELVLADGTVALVGRDGTGLETLRDEVDRVVARHAPAISERLPDLLVKHWPGYCFDELARHPGDLTRLLCGSEGTLAAVSSAVLRVVPLPGRRALGVVFFASMSEAMAAAVELLELEPAAIEHIDRPLFDQTRGQREFAAARALLGLDDEPCESILLVELFGER